ncbi:MAG: hypothetical protein ABW007_04250 [Chitinophagaceae bacterium]
MAIIRKPLLPLNGRYDHVVFYRLPCGLICRALHPHTRKRILKDPKFAEFRKCSKLMAMASKIGSAVYQSLPRDFRQFWMYRAFVGEAFIMLKDKEMTGEQALESLFKIYVEVWYIKATSKTAERRRQREKNVSSLKQTSTVNINIRRKAYTEVLPFNDFHFAIPTRIFNKGPGYPGYHNMGSGPPFITEASQLA